MCGTCLKGQKLFFSTANTTPSGLKKSTHRIFCDHLMPTLRHVDSLGLLKTKISPSLGKKRTPKYISVFQREIPPTAFQQLFGKQTVNIHSYWSSPIKDRTQCNIVQHCKVGFYFKRIQHKLWLIQRYWHAVANVVLSRLLGARWLEVLFVHVSWPVCLTAEACRMDNFLSSYSFYDCLFPVLDAILALFLLLCCCFLAVVPLVCVDALLKSSFPESSASSTFNLTHNKARDEKTPCRIMWRVTCAVFFLFWSLHPAFFFTLSSDEFQLQNVDLLDQKCF